MLQQYEERSDGIISDRLLACRYVNLARQNVTHRPTGGPGRRALRVDDLELVPLEHRRQLRAALDELPEPDVLVPCDARGLAAERLRSRVAEHRERAADRDEQRCCGGCGARGERDVPAAPDRDDDRAGEQLERLVA